MGRIPISIQLYSLREAAKQDFPRVLEMVADMGYVGVEFAGYHGMPAVELRKILDDLGLVASSTHGPLPTKDNLNEVIDTARTLGFTRHIAGFGPKGFETREATLESAGKAQEAAQLLVGSGITFGIHNHYWEFDKLFDGKTPHELFMENAPGVFAQIDTYWVAVAGGDAAQVVAALGPRAPLLHIKDGPVTKEEAMTAVGAGKMDWNAVIGAAAPETEWLVVELDRCDTDMAEAVARSCVYLTSSGFAEGRK
jgi:sugar phosphate isomerase/epimerase